MYIPIDPANIENPWSKLTESLIRTKASHTICKAKKNVDMSNSRISGDEVKNLILSLKDADYVRLGSNRSKIEPVHFAIKYINTGKGVLVELVNADSSSQTLHRDIDLIIQFAFFENPQLMELSIPLLIRTVNDPEVETEIDDKNQRTIVKRKFIR